MKKDFLLEIGTEELPPKSLQLLQEKLFQGIASRLGGTHENKILAAPRRLAVLINNIDVQQPEQIKQGPPASIAYDTDKKPTNALLAFLKKNPDVSLEQLYIDEAGKVACKTVGQKTIDLLPSIVIDAIKALPIAKPMHWGNSDIEFIRPVHWVVMLFGDEVVHADILGKKTGRITHGHRFHAPQAIELKSPDEYESKLKEAKVIVDFEERKNIIKNDIDKIGKNNNAWPAINPNNPALLNEVTSIVEWPVVLCASFNERFLSVPQEALISAMQGHQKSFPMIGSDNKIRPKFIFVANIESRDPQQVITGNEKVMRARLSDALFFYETDIKTPLEDNLENLKTVVFQTKLGTMYDRALRIAKLAQYIVDHLQKTQPYPESSPQASGENAYRAGLLCKADLMSTMVNEFPELQGIMGYYYAKEKEGLIIAQAISDHYQPAFAGDHIPVMRLSIAVALADKLDTLVGIFGINQQPTGDKDPFALRRAAIGVVRLLTDIASNSLNLENLLKVAIHNYEEQSVMLENNNVLTEVRQFIFERFKGWLLENHSVDGLLFNAVNANNINDLNDFIHRANAVKSFLALPQAQSLIAANKRVVNILTKQNALELKGEVNPVLLKEPAEKNLYEVIKNCHLENLDYETTLKTLANLQAPIDAFFEHVMVMVDDKAMQHNRLLLLSQLRSLFMTVADISELA
jgi:glycyl-tRNA synthetase beta chain